MPISHAYDPANRWILVRTSGSPSEEELLAGVERILTDPDLPERPRFLSDSREIEVVASPEFVRRVVELVGRHAGALAGATVAMVATNPANFGMQRMLSLRAESAPLELRVFSDIDAAQRWLADA